MTPQRDSFHVKICGIKCPSDADLAIAAGADMLGLNFVPTSPRFIEVHEAQAIARAVYGRAQLVGVFADEDEARMRDIVAAVGLDLVQLHGSERPEFVSTMLPHAFKAVSIGSAQDVEFAKTYPGELLLVDARVAGQRGGTGVRIDPDLVAPLARLRPILLAGGLRPENVAEAVRHVQPRGVDVASGVETSPGFKDEGMMREFVMEARRAAQEVFQLRTNNE